MKEDRKKENVVYCDETEGEISVVDGKLHVTFEYEKKKYCLPVFGSHVNEEEMTPERIHEKAEWVMADKIGEIELAEMEREESSCGYDY